MSEPLQFMASFTLGAQLEAQHGHRARKGKLVDSKLKPPFALSRLPEA